MKQTRLIPLYRTFTNWIIIVAIGSILLPVVSQMLGGNSTFSGHTLFDDETLGLILISMIASAIFSIPALVVMFIGHLILNRKVQTPRKHQLIQNSVHLFAALITFGVMKVEMGTNDAGFVIAIAFAYLPVGIVVWNITYLLYKRKKILVAEKSDLLD